MLRLTLKNILANKRRLISSVLSVVIGIAFLSGTFVFTDTLQKTFDDLFATVYSKTDTVVRSSQKIDLGRGVSQRGRISDSVIATVAAVPGVTLAVGSVSGYARLVGKNGKPLGTDRGAPHFGRDISESALSVWKMATGRIPRGSGEVAVDAKSYKDGRYALGDSVEVLSQAGSKKFTLVGVVRFGSVDSPAGASFALFDLPTAEAFVGQAGQIDEVYARGDGSLSQSDLTKRIAAVMPAGTESLTGKQVAADASNEIKKNLKFFNVVLLVFAAVALFVGSFIIYNTFSILVAQRSRQNALLRAVGASRRQVMTALLLESISMGVVGSVVGFVAGLGMASVLKGFLAVIGIPIPGGSLVLLPRTAIVSIAVGVVITTVAAVLPARRGSRVPPVAAMRDVAVEQRAFSPKRLAGGLAVLGLAVLLVVVGLTGQLGLLGVAVLLVFIGLFVLGPLIARPMSRFIGAPLPKMRGVVGSMAQENAMRNPKRTARTAAALMVGVALVAAISTLAASIKASVRDIFARQFTGDYVVSTQTFGFGGLPPLVAKSLQGLPEVEAASGVQIGYAKVNSANQFVSVVDPATAGKVFDLKFRSGSLETLDAAGVMVSKKKADSAHLSVGDTVTMAFLDGQPRTVTVRGIYEKDQLAGPYTIAKALYALSGADQYDFSVYVLKKPGASAAETETAIRKAVDAFPTAKVESRTAYITSQANQLNTFVNLIYGLLFLAIVIAVFGIANTLSLSVHERTRELGLVRAVGATRSQIRSIIRWESVITAVLGALQGIVIGVVLGFAVVIALRDQGFSQFSLPVITLLVVLVLAMGCGVIAAARPARRAARLDVLRAIASE